MGFKYPIYQAHQTKKIKLSFSKLLLQQKIILLYQKSTAKF